MKKYIEQEAAIELGKKQSCAGIIDGGDYCNISANMLRNIPTADVVEVKHGQWIYNNMGGWHCSECNNQALFWCMASTQHLTNYCPNCGAKMENSTSKHKEGNE